MSREERNKFSHQLEAQIMLDIKFYIKNDIKNWSKALSTNVSPQVHGAARMSYATSNDSNFWPLPLLNHHTNPARTSPLLSRDSRYLMTPPVLRQQVSNCWQRWVEFGEEPQSRRSTDTIRQTLKDRTHQWRPYLSRLFLSVAPPCTASFPLCFSPPPRHAPTWLLHESQTLLYTLSLSAEGK